MLSDAEIISGLLSIAKPIAVVLIVAMTGYASLPFLSSPLHGKLVEFLREHNRLADLVKWRRAMHR